MMFSQGSSIVLHYRRYKIEFGPYLVPVEGGEDVTRRYGKIVF